MSCGLPVDRAARDELAGELARLLRGEVRCHAFAKVAWRFVESDDDDLAALAAVLADDMEGTWPRDDHLVYTDAAGWASLVRTVAFLRSDCRVPRNWHHADCYPFADMDQWRASEHLLARDALPVFDKRIHGQPHPEVPGWVMYPLIGVVLFLALVVIGGMTALLISHW